MKKTHGMSRTPIGTAWRHLLERCYQKNHRQYRHYGGRGIVACEVIRATPVNLLLLLGDRPDGMSLDRTDNDGGYTCGKCAECLGNNWPMNVRWATPTEQIHNQRPIKSTTRLITINGVTKPVLQWSRETGLRPATIRRRFYRGWDDNRILLPKQHD